MFDIKKIKSSLNSLYSKAHANKTNYLAFVVITVVLAWLVLGKFGVSIAIIYFIFKTKFMQKQLPKLKNKNFASAVIVIGTLTLFGGIFGFAQFIQTMISHGMASYVPQPVAVTSTTVEKSDWKQIINTIGEAQAIQSTEISSQSGGIVSEITLKVDKKSKKVTYYLN